MTSHHGTRCPNAACGETIAPGDSFCEACGAPLPAGGPGAAPAGAWPPSPRDRMETVYPDLAAISDRGLRRARNEDAIAVARLDERKARIVIVCDGVSTAAEPAEASDVASRAALASLLDSLRAGEVEPEAAMREALVAAQDAVCRVPYTPAIEIDPPATTLVAAVILPGTATIGWVGDSRAYFVGQQEAFQLSNDDTWAMEQVAMGAITVEEALADPRAHALTRWLGDDQDGELEASVRSFPFPGSGCLLLCSDGLWNYAPSSERLRELVVQFPEDATAGDVARGLTEFARSLGGADNITVAVAFV